MTRSDFKFLTFQFQDHWWQVQNKLGEVGFIPSNYVKEKDALGLQNFEWYVADMSRQRAESLLKSEDKEGCFVVRNSSTKGLYTLSLYTKIPHAQVSQSTDANRTARERERDETHWLSLTHTKL